MSLIRFERIKKSSIKYLFKLLSNEEKSKFQKSIIRFFAYSLKFNRECFSQLEKNLIAKPINIHPKYDFILHLGFGQLKYKKRIRKPIINIKIGHKKCINATELYENVYDD